MKGLKVFYTQNKVTLTYLLLLPFLFFLSFIYAFFLILRNFLYKAKILRSYRPKAKVISVGNITLGGSGKTPFVEYLASLLFEKGRRVAILLKGYKRPKENDGRGAPEFFLCGDEGSMLKKQLGERALLAIGSNRARLAQRVDEERAPDTIILDDGFQHLKIQRDLDIITIDATNPFGHKFLLPAGHLREGMASLKRAHLFCLTHTDEVNEEELQKLEALLHSIASNAAIVRAIHSPEYLYSIRRNAKENIGLLKGLKIGLFCGIANPFSFLTLIQKLGATVVLGKFFQDHHCYQEEEIENLIKECNKLNLSMLITTEKDAQRLEGLIRKKDWDIDVLFLRIILKVTKGFEDLDERLSSFYHS